jgi:hypothetical protein
MLEELAPGLPVRASGDFRRVKGQQFVLSCIALINHRNIIGGTK